jgi:hypothetical protein
MDRRATYEVFVGESLPDLGLFLRLNGVLVTGLNTGYTFSLKVASVVDGTVVFTKTTGFTGQGGAGFPPLGMPNLVVQWATSGELALLTAGASYRAQLWITRGSDGRRLPYEWLIVARAAL